MSQFHEIMTYHLKINFWKNNLRCGEFIYIYRYVSLTMSSRTSQYLRFQRTLWSLPFLCLYKWLQKPKEEKEGWKWRCSTIWCLGDWERWWQRWSWANQARTEPTPQLLSIPSRTITFSFTLSWWVCYHIVTPPNPAILYQHIQI